VKRITRASLDLILQHAREAAPEECCGLLLGNDQLVSEARPARNVAEQRATRFVIDPRDHFNAIRAARERSLEIVGYYHSHPRSAPIPSDTDRAEAESSDHLYVIVGLSAGQPDVRLYRHVEGNFLPQEFMTVA
jgi:proteasome lid subunit RPN8/RPN11